jgi:hypothetical protein
MNLKYLPHSKLQRSAHMCFIAALAAMFLTAVGSARAYNTTLDDLFNWAAHQPQHNDVTVKFFMTTDDLTANGTVSHVTYIEGTFVYSPTSGAQGYYKSDSFGSWAGKGAKNTSAQQYFSDRRYYHYSPTGSPDADYPFNHEFTEPIAITINRPFISPDYSVVVHLLKSGSSFSFKPNVDLLTGVVYGSVWRRFITIAFGDRGSFSQPIPN